MSRKGKDDILEKFGIHIIDTDSPEYKYGITLSLIHISEPTRPY